jgi:hypothetical protein
VLSGADQRLDVPLDLARRAIVACRGIEVATAIRRRGEVLRRQTEAQALREIGERLRGHRFYGLIALADHERWSWECGDCRNALELSADR